MAPSNDRLNALIIDESSDFRKMLRAYLEAAYGAITHEASSANEGIHVLKQAEGINFVICSNEMSNDSVQDVLKYFSENEVDVPLMLTTDENDEISDVTDINNLVGVARKPNVTEDIQKTIEKTWGFTPIFENPEEDGDDYVGVRIDTILKIGILHYDLFLKMNEKKFLKIMLAGDHFDQSDVDRFKLKDVTFLYVRASDANLILKDYENNFKTLFSAQNSDVKEVFSMSRDTLETIYDISNKMGWSTEVKDICKSSIALAVHTVAKHSDLRKMVAEMELDADSYIVSHSNVLAYVACGIAKTMGWDSEYTHYKLTLAAILHDLALPNKDAKYFASITAAAQKKEFLNDREVLEYHDHPILMYEDLKKFPDIPPDVCDIVLQHHERPDGTGFPKQLSGKRIYHLSSLFIYAEDLVDFFHGDNSQDLLEFLNERSIRYEHDFFKKIHDAIVASVIQDDQVPDIAS